MPELSYERIQERHQTGDVNITLKLLKDLHKKHEKFILSLPEKDCIIIEILKDTPIVEVVNELFRKLSPIIVRFVENPQSYF